MAQKADLTKFRELLKRKPIPVRFKVDRYVEDIPVMLRECYIDEVERRGIPFIDDTETGEHIRKTAGWLVNPANKPGLILFGTVGNGKTTLARAICRLIGILYNSSLSTERKGVVIISALEFATIAKNEPERFENLKKTELLFIDDVGVEPSVIKSWGNEISPFVDTVYYRYDKQLFTIMTSNLNAEELAEKYGDRVADRFREMFDSIAFENKTYRR